MRLSLRNLTNWMRTAPMIVVLASATIALSACIVETNQCDGTTPSSCGGSGGSSGTAGSGGSGGGSAATVVKAKIDAGQTLETTPGDGIGVFVEYAKGGTWHVYTACDTARSGYSCAHDVLVTVMGSTYKNLRNDSLEGQDRVDQFADGFQLLAETSSDLDGVYFDANPGATVRFDVYLDGSPDGRFFYWFGGGALHAGAPSNPIDLVPSEP